MSVRRDKPRLGPHSKSEPITEWAYRKKPGDIKRQSPIDQTTGKIFHRGIDNSHCLISVPPNSPTILQINVTRVNDSLCRKG